MQRAIEEAGIPTIIIAALPPVVRQTGTPRAVAPLVPMGANAGGPHNVEQQTQIVKATLEQLVEQNIHFTTTEMTKDLALARPDLKSRHLERSYHCHSST